MERAFSMSKCQHSRTVCIGSGKPVRASTADQSTGKIFYKRQAIHLLFKNRSFLVCNFIKINNPPRMGLLTPDEVAQATKRRGRVLFYLGHGIVQPSSVTPHPVSPSVGHLSFLFKTPSLSSSAFSFINHTAGNSLL